MWITLALSAAGARLDAEHEAGSQIGPPQARVKGATAGHNRNRIQVRRAKETSSSVHDQRQQEGFWGHGQWDMTFDRRPHFIEK